MYSNRIDALRKTMRGKGIDGILLVGDANRNYLSGFTGNESFSVITMTRAIFITDSRFTEQAKQQVVDYELLEYKGLFADFLGNLVKNLEITKLGFEENVLTYSLYSSYVKRLDCEFIPLDNMVEDLRMIKDEFEIQCIRDAASIADKAFEHMLKFIKSGMTEIEVGIELEFTMKKLGAKALSFPSIIASGVRSCLPHGSATQKIINVGDFLTLDFGCVYNEYCSDMTRTIAIGKIDKKMEEIYNVVFEAQEKALGAYKPCVTGAEIDKVARDVISKAGYGDRFGHGLGHGVGREVHEMPRISPMGNMALKSGMVVTDEPGIYVPNLGGVRIEDLLVIRKNGCEVLSKSSKKLICI